MKLIQVNTWLGHAMDQLLDFMRAEQPDIVCAQEVLEANKINPLFSTYNLLSHIREAGSFGYDFFSPTLYFNALGSKVKLGNAIFSKFPITQTTTTFIHGDYRRQTADNFERNIRNLQICRLQIAASQFVTIANHHGFHDLNPLGTTETVAAMQKVATTLQLAPRPLIFCGDLNISPASPALETLNALRLRNLVVDSKTATTLSQLHRVGNRDKVVCDYIFASPGLQVKNFTVSEALISDHKALILEFDV